MTQKIKLLIHESFFDAFAMLPRQIQKKTRELMRKFREDPTSSAINYEKISAFQDQSLRTVRVDQKYRAIIKAPEAGNAYTLLWVDNHDEAMDWAKNKVFEFNDTTKAYQLYEKTEQAHAIENQEAIGEIKSNIEIPKLSDQFSDEQLRKLGTPEVLLADVKELTNSNDLERISSKLPKDNYEYLYYLMEGISIEEILDEINQGTNVDEDNLSSNAKRSIYLVDDDHQLEEILAGDLEKWKIFLHPSQRHLAYGQFKGPAKVLGGAGTGKTVCAMHRLKYLSNVLGVFDQPILFTTFTKSLSSSINETIKSMGIDSNKYEVINIDHLVFKLSKAYGVIPSDAGLMIQSQEEQVWLEVLKEIPSIRDQYFLSEEYNNVILTHRCVELNDYLKAPRIGRSVRIGRKDKVEIWEQYQLFTKRKGNTFTKNELCNSLSKYLESHTVQPYSYLICDELQDFNSIELRLLRQLVPEKENDLFLVGDPFQNIYSKNLRFSDAGINVRGRRSKILKVNYRTTEEIKKLAISAMKNVSRDNFDGDRYEPKGYVSLLHGKAPSYQLFATLDEEVNNLIENIQNQRAAVGDHGMCIAARTNSLLDRVKRSLSEQGLDYDDLGKMNKAPNTISISTFHNLKGHEFKTLFLFGVTNSTVPFMGFPGYEYFNEVQRLDYEIQERSLLYVAITRAIHSLYISGNGERCDFLD